MTTAGLEEREFRIDDERDPRRTIRGRVTYPAGAEERGERLPYVLVLHGFKGFMDWGFFPELARRLVARGLAVVRFNFSGSGVGADLESFGDDRAFHDNTPSREVEDLERVRTWLDHGAVPWIDPRRGQIVAHSLGGAVGLLHAARRQDYLGLVLWASVSHFQRFGPEVEALWRRQGFLEIPNLRTRQVHRLGVGWLEDVERNPRALDVHGACRNLTTPALLLHGDRDDAVPLHEGESLLRAFPEGVARLEVLPGANHTFGAVHPFTGVPADLERVLAATAAFVDEKSR